jgi:serine kinase of HPr protein (carbohydrate metabolism regulator)
MADSPDSLFLQATCVAVDGVGVLLRGPSGGGKSDLALRLIDGGARLVADDGVELSRRGDDLVARLPAMAPDSVRGRIEVRGLGILPVPSVDDAIVGLVVDLVDANKIERLPLPATVDLLGLSIPVIDLAGPEPSAPAKVRLAVRLFKRSIIRPS